VSGESHYSLAQLYRLRVIEEGGSNRLLLKGKTSMLLKMRSKKPVRELLDKWQPILGVVVNAWGIQRMRTKWGTCNIEARRIWLNLELDKKPMQCLEYI
jgi:predicted metal-dependent hydrolase